MRKKTYKKLTLSSETLRKLEASDLEEVKGGAVPQTRVTVCEGSCAVDC